MSACRDACAVVSGAGVCVMASAVGGCEPLGDSSGQRVRPCAAVRAVIVIRVQ